MTRKADPSPSPYEAPERRVLRIRVLLGDDGVFGPGKADLLERIAETGSISAAGRSLAMSYKRAWSLVEEMNALFAAPLVESARGGPAGGGARLTENGEQILGLYRDLEDRAARTGAETIDALQARLRPPAKR